MNKLLYVGLLILFSLIGCQQSNETKKQKFKEILKQLNQHTHPLKSPLPSSSLSDLTPLNMVGNSPIVALGEATHGTKEFFQLKHKIFRYLVETHDFRIFAFESDMGEAVYLNDYVQGGSGDIAQIMADKMHFWTWKTKEVEALLKWMRSYNEGKPSSKRVCFIGMDTQFMTYQPTLIEEYIEIVRPELVGEAQSVLNNIEKLTAGTRRQTRSSYQNMTESQKVAISDTLDYLLRKMKIVKEEMVLASSELEYKTAYQLVRNLQQVHQYSYASLKLGERGLRDEYMAENTLWASQLFGEETKVAVWAHNGHISEAQSGYVSMGYHLDNKIGDDYTSIAFSFNQGSFTAVGFDTTSNEHTGIEYHSITSSPVLGSINHLFSFVKEENFIFNIDALELNSALGAKLSKPQGLLQIGAVYAGDPREYYRSTVLPESFDFVIHLDSTGHSTSVR